MKVAEFEIATSKNMTFLRICKRCFSEILTATKKISPWPISVLENSFVLYLHCNLQCGLALLMFYASNPIYFKLK